MTLVISRRRVIELATAIYATGLGAAMTQELKQGYSVDRRGVYSVGGTLDLMKVDPLGRVLQEPKDVEAINSDIAQRYVEGLSRHGWDYTMTASDFIQHQTTKQNYILYESQLELVLELVRRLDFPQLPSRMQSWFAWETLDQARAFCQGTQRIFRLGSTTTFRGDQGWLALGRHSATTWRNVHQYWSGAASPQPRWETVLRAPVSVLEEVV